MEQLSDKDLIPSKWTPKPQRLFFVEMDEVSSYLVKRVEMPSLKKNFWGTKMITSNDLVIVCHSAANPSTESQIQTLAYRKKPMTDIVVNQLDCVGKVIGKWIFKKPRLSKYDIDSFNYDNGNSIGELKVSFKCSEVAFEHTI